MLSSLSKALKNKLSFDKVSKNRSSSRRTGFRPGFERLETRDMMAADALQMNSLVRDGMAQQNTYSVDAYVATNTEEVGQADQADFEIATILTKPGTSILYGPDGTTTDRTPTFRWSAANNATWYRLYVWNDTTGQVVIDKWVQGTKQTNQNTHLPPAAPAHQRQSSARLLRSKADDA